MATIPTDPELKKRIPRRDMAVAAAGMFVYSVPKAKVLAICMEGETTFIKTIKKSGIYNEYQFMDDDLRAIFKMIVAEVADDLNFEAKKV